MPLKNWLVLNVPVATNTSKPIIATVRTEIVVDEKGVKSQPLSGEAGEELRDSVARQIKGNAHRARKILWQKNSYSGE